MRRHLALRVRYRIFHAFHRLDCLHHPLHGLVSPDASSGLQLNPSDRVNCTGLPAASRASAKEATHNRSRNRIRNNAPSASDWGPSPDGRRLASFRRLKLCRTRVRWGQHRRTGRLQLDVHFSASGRPLVREVPYCPDAGRGRYPKKGVLFVSSSDSK